MGGAFTVYASAHSQLLRLNPQYASWIEGLPDAKVGMVAFIKASTWPDAIKTTPGYSPDGAPRSNGKPPDLTAGARRDRPGAPSPASEISPLSLSEWEPLSGSVFGDR